MAIQRLPVAYRSRSRPSSTLGAKASTMCSIYLDGDQPDTERIRLVIPVRPGGLSQCRACGCCTVFKDRREGCRRRSTKARRLPVSQNSTACTAAGPRYANCAVPGPVDIPGCAVGGRRAPRLEGLFTETAPCRAGPIKDSLERR